MAAEGPNSAAVKAAGEELLDFVESFSAVKQVPHVMLDSFEDVMYFMREHVARNRPAVISGLMAGSPALAWSPEDMASQHGEAEVDVNMTPNGLADAIVPTWCLGDGRHSLEPPHDAPDTPPTSCFLEPHVASLPLGVALQQLAAQARTPRGQWRGDVAYISAQNDSLREQFPFLAPDVPPSLPWASSIFGAEPDAINVWIGDQHSVSSTHKDPYENLYAVVHGVKVFTLLPPGDTPWLNTHATPHGKYTPLSAQQGGGWRAQLSTGEGTPQHACGCSASTVPWVGVDPCSTSAAVEHPPFARASPVTVKVQAGETLYLPALWYHRVTQEGLCIAVNYWHDMSYGPAYALNQVVQALAPALSAAASVQHNTEQAAP